METTATTAKNNAAHRNRRTRLVNRTTDEVVAGDAVLARTLIGQLLGFIAHRRNPWPDGALGIPNCDRVHTFFVARPLDLAFCDREGRVLQVITALPSNRLGPRVFGAKTVWESEAGGIAPSVSVGDILALEIAGG